MVRLAHSSPNPEQGFTRWCVATVLFSCCLLSACTTTGPVYDVPNPEQPAGEDSSEPNHEAEPPSRDPSTATYALLNSSVAAEQAGDLPKAIRQLERAIRIEPKDSSLWTRLASLYGLSQNTARARQYANKAISLAGERGDLKRAAWLVLADIEEQDGNFNQAADIRRRFASVRG